MDSFEARIRELHAQEMQEPTRWWYLSFAGDDGWKGACIVPGKGVITATLMSKRLKANPGGEVLVIPVPEDLAESIPAEAVGRLLTREEVQRYCGELVDLRT
jgi:hypothetical protein